MRVLLLALLLPLTATAQTTDAECRIDGMQHAYDLWREDPAEAASIKASGGRVVREKSILKVTFDDGRHVTFFDLIPTTGEDVTCGHIEAEIHRLEGIDSGRVRLSRNGVRLSVDLTSGIASPD
ncbi:hypothetical protein ACFSM5_16330 [Lacibacterium aquatile]|uniref:Uncharacterized protein n=1 Tax=Lacibacterium aquatile TaxID=1168082 RepID=A0ABW5DTL0_9PROT